MTKTLDFPLVLYVFFLYVAKEIESYCFTVSSCFNYYNCQVGQQQDAYNARAPSLPPLSRTLPPFPPPCAPSYTTDQLQEKVRQEGWVIRRVAELSRDGLWPANRLPKVKHTLLSSFEYFRTNRNIFFLFVFYKWDKYYFFYYTSPSYLIFIRF